MRVLVTIGISLLALVVLAACGPAAPVAGFEASNVTGDIPISVSFTDLSKGEIDSWEWDFDGDGIADNTEQNPTYSFGDPCNCTVTLTVRGPGGEDSVLLPLIFTPVKLVADFAADPTEGQGKTTVNFTDLSLGRITAWAWDFNNDGTIDSTDQHSSYRYTRNGNYTVVLSVSGPYGNDTMTKADFIHMTGCPT